MFKLPAVLIGLIGVISIWMVPINAWGQSGAVLAEPVDLTTTTSGVTPAKLIKVYPPTMPRAARESGYCCMSVTVNAKGRPKDPEPLYCSSPKFIKSSKRAIRKYRFEPATREGLAVDFQAVDLGVIYIFSDRKGEIKPSADGRITADYLKGLRENFCSAPMPE